MRTKPARPTARSSVVERHPHQVALAGGVQPRVVALRLDVAHVAALHEPGDAAELDGDRLVVVGRHRIGPAPSASPTRRTASASRSGRTGLSR